MARKTSSTAVIDTTAPYELVSTMRASFWVIGPLLAREGLSPGQVIGEMAEFAGGCDVYADAELDRYWMEVLCDAVGAKVPFPVRHIDDFLSQSGFSPQQIARAFEEAKRRTPREPLAREDARRLALAVKLLLDEPPSRPGI